MVRAEPTNTRTTGTRFGSTYNWLPCTWKLEHSLADSSGAELTSTTSQSILPEVGGSISHWRCANTTGPHVLQIN